MAPLSSVMVISFESRTKYVTMKCYKCNKEMDSSLMVPKQTTCPNCGYNRDDGTFDKELFSTNFIAFIAPGIGILEYFIYKRNYPKTAFGCIKWTTISTLLVNVIFIWKTQHFSGILILFLLSFFLLSICRNPKYEKL